MPPNPCRDIGKPCDLCCKIMAVAELDKPRHMWCPACKHSVGCTIYSGRPESCRDYSCIWALSQTDPNQVTLSTALKPSVCGALINQTKDGKELVIDANDGADVRKGELGQFIINMSQRMRVFVRQRARMRVIFKGQVVADFTDDRLLATENVDRMTFDLLPGVKL